VEKVGILNAGKICQLSFVTSPRYSTASVGDRPSELR